MTTKTNHTTQPPLQLSLFSALEPHELGDSDKPFPTDALTGWDRTGIRALTMDSVDMRLLVARSSWNVDVEIQRCLVSNSDEGERVVLELLAHADLPAELVEQLRTSPHVAVRDDIARRYGSRPDLAA